MLCKVNPKGERVCKVQSIFRFRGDKCKTMLEFRPDQSTAGVIKMAKLTAAQTRSIETVLHHLNRAKAFINDKQTIIARTKRQCTTTDDFEVPHVGPAACIAKDIGSELVSLQMAIEYLQNFVTMNSK